MDSNHVAELTTKFSKDISALKNALEPLLEESLNDRASKLPLLEQAKLYTFAAYSIESILFFDRDGEKDYEIDVLLVSTKSYADLRPANLRLAGADVKSHAVFTELARVQQYFGKIKAAEESLALQQGRGSGPKLRVDRPAVERMIRHELASSRRQVGVKRRFEDNDNDSGNDRNKDSGLSGNDENKAGGSGGNDKNKDDGPDDRGKGDVPNAATVVAQSSSAPAAVSAPTDKTLQDDFMAIDEPKKGKKRAGKKGGRKGNK